MALEVATVAMTLKDKIGSAFRADRTSIRVSTSAKKVIDTQGNETRLGGASLAPGADGTAMVDVWVPGPGANPASWQTTFEVAYPDPTDRSGRGVDSFGPFTIPANVKVTNKALTSNVATLTTGTPHGLSAGDKVTILDVAAPFAGTFTVASAPTATTFTYAVTSANVASTATTGRLAHDLADLVAEMPVQPEYASAVFDRIDGVVDHGSISGAVTFSGPKVSHRFDATGPTTITLDGFLDGQVVSLICFSGAEDVIIIGAPDATLTDGTAWAAEYARDIWITGGGGGEPATPDTTPPTAVTDLAATGGEGELTFSWTPATDAESAVKYGYKVWKTGTTEPSGYTIRTTGGPVTVTGLTAGAYNVKLYSFSSGGSTVADTATATVTSPPLTGWEPSDLSDLAGWWDADDATTFTFASGTVVSEWRDKSTNARHLTQTTPGARPSRSGTINGRPAVLFDGTSDYLSSPNITPTKPGTLLVVARNTATSGQRDVITSRPNEGRVFRVAADTIDIYQGSFLSSGATWGTTNPHAVAAVFAGTSSKLAVDSGSWTNGDAGTFEFGGQGWTVGAIGEAGSEFWQGEICEIVHVNRAITDAERDDWFDYCTAKWGTA